MEPELHQLIHDYEGTSSAVADEDRQRAAIMASEAYATIQAQIEAAQQAQAALFSGIPDSREEYEMDKRALAAYLEEHSIDTLEGFIVKTRRKRNVDVRAVLEAMQGDIDNLMVVSSVKMKDLEDFAKANPEYKRDLRKCIVDEGFSVTDVIPQESSAAA